MIYIAAFFACAIWFATFISPYLVAILVLVSFYHILRATVRATAPRRGRIVPARPQDIAQQRPKKGYKIHAVK